MSDEKAELVLVRELPRIPPGSAGDPFNFINEILQFLTRWCSAYPHSIELGNPAYCCFIGCDRVTTVAESSADFVLRSLFREDTPQDLLAYIYLCAFPLNKVYARPVNLSNLAECEAVIADFGGVQRPSVIFNAADRRVLWRMPGSASLHQVIIRTEPAPKLMSSEFDKALDDFHYEYTEAPDGLSAPWENASEWLPKPQLEREIRNDLFVYLRNLMQDHFAVFREFFGSSGRADLLVHFHTEAKTFYIELKVLREFRLQRGVRIRHVSANFNLRWGKLGLAQAYSYKRSNRHIGIAYACCFDARKKDDELPELVDLAKKFDVEYRRFFMYPSAENLHEALIR